MLAHTNHYLDETLIEMNEKIGRSSRTRLGRIGELWTAIRRDSALQDFIAFSQDLNDGPDDSLCRTGEKTGWNTDLSELDRFLPPAALLVALCARLRQSWRT